MAYAGVILYYKNKIILQLRDKNSRTANPNLWGIFGGKIENGENPEQAAIRELKEELGLNVKKLKPFLKTKFKGEKINIFIKNLRDISNLKIKEGQKIGLFSKEEILKLNNTVPGLKKMTKEYLK